MKRFMFILIFGLSATFGVWYGLNPLLTKNTEPNHSVLSLSNATFINPAKPLPDFSFINSKKQPFTQKTLLGHWTLLFFGYAKCPSICPTTLATISELFRSLSNTKSEQPQFVFVTLNPKNESPEMLNEFLTHFNPNFIGLIGDESETAKLSKSCSIYSFSEINAKGQTIIDHSATLLLINPQGHVQALFSPPHKAEDLVQDLKILMNN